MLPPARVRVMEPCLRRLLPFSTAPAVLTEFIVLERATPGGLETTFAEGEAGVIVLWLLERPLPAPRSDRDFLVVLPVLAVLPASPTLSTDQVLFRLFVTAIIGPRPIVSSSSLESAAAAEIPDRWRRFVSVRVVHPPALREVSGGESAPPRREPAVDSPAGFVLNSLTRDLKNPPFFLPLPRKDRTLDPSDAAPPENVRRKLARLNVLCRFRGGL